jgi:hypothetical protein
MARDEDELNAGRRRGRAEPPPVRLDQEPSIEALAQLDPPSRIRLAVGSSRNLDQARAQADGIVTRNDTRVAAREAIGQIGRGPTPRGDGAGRPLRQALIVGGEIRGEEGLGGRHRRDPVQPELRDGTILQGVPEAFDPAFNRVALPRSPCAIGTTRVIARVSRSARLAGHLCVTALGPGAILDGPAEVGRKSTVRYYFDCHHELSDRGDPGRGPGAERDHAGDRHLAAKG